MMVRLKFPINERLQPSLIAFYGFLIKLLLPHKRTSDNV